MSTLSGNSEPTRPKSKSGFSLFRFFGSLRKKKNPLDIPKSSPNAHRPTITDYATTVGGVASAAVETFATVLVAAELPYLKSAVNVLAEIIRICQAVQTQRESLKALTKKCEELMEVLVEAQNSSFAQTEKLERALLQTTKSLQKVLETVKHLKDKSKVDNFMTIRKTQKIIDTCSLNVSESIGLFQLKATLHHQETLFDLMEGHKQGMEKIIDALAKTEEARASEPETKSNQAIHNRNVARVLDLTEQQMPSLMLSPAHYERGDKIHELSSGAIIVYKASYLEQPEYIVKSYQKIKLDPAKCMERFQREARIWSTLWNVDKGQHIAPIVGYNTKGDYPEIVTKHYPQTAISYVMKGGTLSKDVYRKLIRGIASGVAVLHQLEKPVIHGNIRGDTIVMDYQQVDDLLAEPFTPRPLLSNFELSKIMEGTTKGMEYTGAGASGDEMRWWAPEQISYHQISTKSDVWSFGMTVLELFIHKPPFNAYKGSGMAISDVIYRKLPPQPLDSEVVARGLDDEMWALLCRCWSFEPEARPDIAEVLSML